MNELLLTLLISRVAPPARRWIDEARESAADDTAFAGHYTLASRKLGKAPLALSAEEDRRLRAAGVTWPLGGWSADDLGRVTLLLAAAATRDHRELDALVETLYRAGDNRERQAILRALPFLPASDGLVTIAVDACRTHVQPVFEAIACENPYPAAQFPELNLNQMVLKALFIGVALDRIVGLDARVTPELRRMAAAYASERRAAGRTVPDDISRLVP